jgi:hypothetical protein
VGSVVVVAYVSLPPFPTIHPPFSPEDSNSDFTFTLYTVDFNMPLFLILTFGATGGSFVVSACLSITLSECFFRYYLSSVTGKGGCPPALLFFTTLLWMSLLIVDGSLRG